MCCPNLSLFLWPSNHALLQGLQVKDHRQTRMQRIIQVGVCYFRPGDVKPLLNAFFHCRQILLRVFALYGFEHGLSDSPHATLVWSSSGIELFFLSVCMQKMGQSREKPANPRVHLQVFQFIKGLWKRCSLCFSLIVNNSLCQVEEKERDKQIVHLSQVLIPLSESNQDNAVVAEGEIKRTQLFVRVSKVLLRLETVYVTMVCIWHL